MVLNYIWIAFFVIAFIFALIGLAMGDTTIFQKIVDSTFDSSKNAFEISLGLTGVLALWLGIMKIGEKAGVVNVLARAPTSTMHRSMPKTTTRLLRNSKPTSVCACRSTAPQAKAISRQSLVCRYVGCSATTWR